MATLKDLSKKKELLTGGHRACAGCGATIVARQIMLASDKPVLVLVHKPDLPYTLDLLVMVPLL